MATESKHRVGHVGNWSIPTTVPGGAYGTDTYKVADGTTIFFRYWRAADPAAPVLVFLHGLGAHTGWFIDMGNELNARGLSVYMDDHRGFGRSEGPRGHVRRGAMYLDDIGALLDEVRKRQPKAPIYLAGHSMGGIFALHTATREEASGASRVRGLILINPWIRDTTKITASLVVSVFGAGPFGSQRLVKAAGGSDVMTANPEAVAMLDEDTYWVRAQTSAFLYQVTLLRGRMMRLARLVRMPALVIQSEQDKAVVPAATRACYDALGSTDKEWKTYPSFAHDFEFEPERTALDDDLADWIMRHRA